MNKVIKISLGLSLLMAAVSSFATAAPSQVPVTGETGGAIGSNKGVAWPNPRFVAGTGATADCITDKLTGLMWPKNGIIGFEATDGGELSTQPDYMNTIPNLNQIPWAKALTAVGNMNTASTKLCGYSDWRLPNKVELKSLINYGAAKPANWLIFGTGTKAIPVCSGACFTNIQYSGYWSSTYAAGTDNAWFVNFGSGLIIVGNKALDLYVWPVRGGQ